VVSADELEEEILSGGPVAAFVQGLDNELCGDGTAVCSFQDGRSVSQTINAIFVADSIVTPSVDWEYLANTVTTSDINEKLKQEKRDIKEKVKQVKNDIFVKHSFLTTGSRKSFWRGFNSLWSDSKCDTVNAEKTLEAFFQGGDGHLEDFEANLKGSMPIRAIAKPPPGLKTMLLKFHVGWKGHGNNNTDKSCDFSWYTIVRLCPSGGNGYVLANRETGQMDHVCGPPPSSAWIGPATDVMFNIMLAKEESDFNLKNKETANAIASEAGFFPISTDNEWYQYKRSKWTEDRIAFIQSYVRVDPRLQAKRASFCPHSSWV